MLIAKKSFSKKVKLFSKLNRLNCKARQQKLKEKVKSNRGKAYTALASGIRGIKKTFLIALALLRSLKVNPKFSIVFLKLQRLRTVATNLAGYFFRFGQFISNRRKTITVVFLFSVFIFNIFALNTIGAQLLSQTTLGSTGTITSIGVSTYSDANCVTRITNVNWGTLNPGGAVAKNIFIKNEGNTYMTLSLDTSSWYPTTAQNYMSLSWDYSGQALEPHQIIQVTLILSVSQQVSGIQSFSFEIIITGTN